MLRDCSDLNNFLGGRFLKMACPKDDFLFFNDNSFLINWVEKFYVSIVEANFLANLRKYKNVFDLFSIFTNLSKFNIFLDKEKLLGKLNAIVLRWRGNELTIKNVEIELKKVLFELKEEKSDYKIIVLMCEIQCLCLGLNLKQHLNDFNLVKNELTEKIESNLMTKFEKKIALRKLEQFLNLLIINH